MDEGYNNALAIAALARTNSVQADSVTLANTTSKVNNVSAALGVTYDASGNVTGNQVEDRLTVLEAPRTVPSLGTNYQVTYSDIAVLISASAEVTLPAVKEGYEVAIKKIDNVGSNKITGSPALIDGEVDFTLGTQWQYIRLISDGVNWYKVG